MERKTNGTWQPKAAIPTPREKYLTAYASDSFRAGMCASPSGHNGNSGVAYGIGGGLINVPATPAHLRNQLQKRAGARKRSRRQRAEASTDALNLIIKP